MYIKLINTVRRYSIYKLIHRLKKKISLLRIFTFNKKFNKKREIKRKKMKKEQKKGRLTQKKVKILYIRIAYVIRASFSDSCPNRDKNRESKNKIERM